jgi:hypothetical protein
MFASGTGLLCMPNLSDLGTDTDCGGARRLERIAGNRASVSHCRDCDVRSLAGPEPDRQAKFKHLLRKAAALGRNHLRHNRRNPSIFAQCATYFRNSGYAQS